VLGNLPDRIGLDVYGYRIKMYVGAYVAVLGRVDAIVFTGGIGLRSPEVRRRVCDNLGFLGIAIDPARNESSGDESIVSPDGSPVTVMVMRTNEELIVARQTRAVVERETKLPSRPSA